jgi:hypothetical protein
MMIIIQFEKIVELLDVVKCDSFNAPTWLTL